jgi:copper chaperone CopZ
VSAAGVSAAFERVRPYFLAGAAVLLGAGYYFVFFRKEACAPGSACAAPNWRVERFNKGMLLFATALVFAIALFPSYVGALVGAVRPSRAQAGAIPPSRLETVTLEIEGMTCEGRSVHVRNALAAVPGVQSAEVPFAEGSARVRFDARSKLSTEALLEAVESAGYHASLTSGAR